MADNKLSKEDENFDFMTYINTLREDYSKNMDD